MKTLRIVLMIALVSTLPLTFNQCSGELSSIKMTSKDSSQGISASSAPCPIIQDQSVKDLKSIDDAVRLINYLPKPVSIDCFVANIKKPYKVFAVDNPFSAQSSFGVDSPRIFIISNNLSVSVVPAGPAKDFVELSLVTAPMASVKAEIKFPINQMLTADAAYTRVLDGTYGTSCRVCHQNESKYTPITTGEAYVSGIITPDPFKRVSQNYLLGQAQKCTDLSDFRCRLLRTLYIDGSATDVNFPTQPN